MSSATPIEPSGPDQDRLSLDDEGFSRLYRVAAQDLVVFFARRTYDPEAAADLMAETFAKAYLGRRRFRGSTDEAARAWLFGIARRRHRNPEVTKMREPDETPLPLVQTFGEELERAIANRGRSRRRAPRRALSVACA